MKKKLVASQADLRRWLRKSNYCYRYRDRRVENVGVWAQWDEALVVVNDIIRTLTKPAKAMKGKRK